MEQRISSPEQQKWVTKLFGYDYEIIYKKEKTMWLQMHFPENMKMKDPFFLFPSLYQIGFEPFARNGYKIPKVHS
jgi:hypothetical protein